MSINILAFSKDLVAKRLKEARLRANLSQKKLGIAAGIDEFSASARMNQYETGRHVPDLLTLKQISKVLNVPIAFFYAEEDLLSEFLIIYEYLSKPSRAELVSSAKKLVKHH